MILDAASARLRLPAAERRAVVFEAEGDAHDGFPKRNWRGNAPPIVAKAAGASERGDELLRLFLLGRRAFLGDLLEDLARPILVADLEVGLGQLELGADRFAAARFRRRIEAQVGEVERTGAARRGRRCGRGFLGGGLRAREIESGKVEIERGLLFLRGL